MSIDRAFRTEIQNTEGTEDERLEEVKSSNRKRYKTGYILFTQENSVSLTEK